MLKKTKNENIQISDKIYTIETEYKYKVKNATCYIKKNKIKIVIPKLTTIKEKERLYKDLKLWAIKKIYKDLKNNSLKKEEKIYYSGYIVKTVNKQYNLKINYKNKKSSSAKLKDDIIILNLSNFLKKEDINQIINNLIGRVIAEDYKKFIEKRINYFNILYFNQNIKSINIKNTYSQWGSCSIQKKLSFSPRIFLFDLNVIDYLIVHEMSHLVYLNHSSNFWKLVESIIPDYKKYKKILNSNSNISF